MKVSEKRMVKVYKKSERSDRRVYREVKKVMMLPSKEQMDRAEEMQKSGKYSKEDIYAVLAEGSVSMSARIKQESAHHRREKYRTTKN